MTAVSEVGQRYVCTFKYLVSLIRSRAFRWSSCQSPWWMRDARWLFGGKKPCVAPQFLKSIWIQLFTAGTSPGDLR